RLRPGPVVHPGRVLVLSLDTAATNGEDIERVRSDAALEDLVATSRGVEMPPTVARHDRNRHRPIVVADDEGRARRILRVDFQGVLLPRFRDERRRTSPVLNWVGGGDQGLALGA